MDPEFHVKMQELLDKNEIRELTARYNHTFDDGDAEAFADTYTVDGGHTPDWEAADSSGNGTQRGRDQHIAQCRRVDRRVVHATTDSLIEIDGDTARQVCTFIIFVRDNDKTMNQFALTGRYVDQLTRTAEGWRFAERRSLWDLQKPLSEILAQAERSANAGA